MGNYLKVDQSLIKAVALAFVLFLWSNAWTLALLWLATWWAVTLP